MKPVPIQFRFRMDDPFQVRLEEAIKTLRHGTRNLFLVNLCRALFGGMEIPQMQTAMLAISYSQEEALEELLCRAISRFEIARSFQVTKNTTECRDPPPAIKRVMTGPVSLKSLSIGDD
jgi:hypothetical protein